MNTFTVSTHSCKKNMQPQICSLGKTLPISVLASMNIFLSCDCWKMIFLCMDTKHGKRAHKRFLTDELGPENENNLQIGKVTWGHKYLRFCLKSSLEFFLSLPLTFPIYLIIYQHPKYHQSTGNMTFRLLTSKIDVLPISQDFPSPPMVALTTQKR